MKRIDAVNVKMVLARPNNAVFQCSISMNSLGAAMKGLVGKYFVLPVTSMDADGFVPIRFKKTRTPGR
jgi:hypothetical protein